MRTKITVKGRIIVPKPVREALRLSPGDLVEFAVNGNGEVLLRKALTAAPQGTRREPGAHPRAQMRRRAAELLALLRGLD
jgi:antitoxin PrlF